MGQSILVVFAVSVQRALDAGHPEVLKALRDRLLSSMLETGLDPDSMGLSAQVAAQLLKVAERLYIEQVYDEASYMADLGAICDTLAQVVDKGPPSVLAQSSGVLVKAEALVAEINLKAPQETDVDTIIGRKPAASKLVPARRGRG